MKYVIFSEPRKIFDKMILDIRRAKKEIVLETYIYDGDSVGRRFLDELTKKASEGVKVRILIDAWGTGVKGEFFKKLVDAGGKVRFFRELRYALRLINANHERSHRKLLVIDKKISYIGSVNITASCLDWSELVLRMDAPVSKMLRLSFGKMWKRFNSKKVQKMRKVIHDGFEIIHDFPSVRHIPTERSYRKLIGYSRDEILIITPYFLPSVGIRRALKRAIGRGVEVKIIVPRVSDVRMSDLFRNRYLGMLDKMGVKIYYFRKVIHSKMLVVDDSFFLLGSSNLDYRSFRHQYEINLLSKNEEVITLLRKFFYKNLKLCKIFSYKEWKDRGFVKKFMERFLWPIRENF